MAPTIIDSDAVQGETFLPKQIFVFGGFALRANSLGHLEQMESYAPGHLVRFGSLNYTAYIRGDLIFDGFEPLPCAPRGHDEHDLALPSNCVKGTGSRSEPQFGASRAFRGRVDGPRHGGLTLSGDRAKHRPYLAREPCR